MMIAVDGILQNAHLVAPLPLVYGQMSEITKTKFVYAILVAVWLTQDALIFTFGNVFQLC